MIITRKQLRRLIQEGYRELQNQQSRAYKSGDVGGLSGAISTGPSKRYYEGLRAYLYHNEGIDSRRRSRGSYSLSNGHNLNVAISRSWPHGFVVIRQSVSTHNISFTVTGNPEVDAEFIARLCALSDDDFLRIGSKTRGESRVGSWESEIIPGYPHKFIGL